MSASAKWFRQNGPLGEMSFGEKDFQRKVRIPLKSTMSSLWPTISFQLKCVREESRWLILVVYLENISKPLWQ
ncbi:hypothetical protein RIR_jg10212.t1 [Rhizophagus irregularis DAOM 181602=DAOM 197198]|nr:hypothetical protein RIR_jg10212.t1 [Rhizophagus irregularis DAOM 181602=DAOM 197198]